MTARTYPVPSDHRGAVLGATATLDQIDLAATLGDAWARLVLNKENARVLGPVLGQDRVLPEGVLEGEAVTGLWRGGLLWQSPATGWVAGGAPADTELLDSDSVAFVARALDEGYRSVVLYPYTPVALLSASESTPAPAGASSRSGPELPEGAKVLAVVDEYDRNAVMDLVVVLPGPKVMRRHDGEWRDDPTWLSVLRSVRPPPVVEVAPDVVPGVVDQIDEATAGQPFNETEKDQAGQEADKPPLAASGWLERSDEMLLTWALVAASQGLKAKAKAKGYDVAGVMPPELQRYWTVGEGAAKIRWFTPGSWRRCHRLLTKYVGPQRAKGLCTNLGQKLGGHGVAWGVGD